MTKSGIFALICAIIYSALLCVSSYQIGVTYARKEFAEANQTQANAAVELDTNAQAQPAPTPSPDVPHYLIKEYNGAIGIYENGDLSRIIDVNIKTLPANDIKELQQGIEVGSKEELAEILENYTS
ncbi:MAG: BofC C-terminal domain-containing protein [Clostridiales bacterium]|jgi:hypothetical protein|nr:BofC C-terminal domain-containing protein [Clostridiales bacterium]